MPRFPRAAAADGVGISTGAIVPYGGAAAPDGFLLCDGAAISRTTYSALFAIIGTSYGVGDGSTTFNIPDLQGNVPVGKGASGVTNIGDTGGEQTHTLSTNEMPAHTHYTAAEYTGSGNIKNVYEQYGPSASVWPSSSTGGGADHNNMQPYVGTEYIIKT